MQLDLVLVSDSFKSIYLKGYKSTNSPQRESLYTSYLAAVCGFKVYLTTEFLRLAIAIYKHTCMCKDLKRYLLKIPLEVSETFMSNV